MNYRFLRLSRLLALAFFLFGKSVLSAQDPAAALPDSLPNPDSLSAGQLATWAGLLSNQAKNFETEFSRKTLTASIVREAAEQNLKTAKQDTLTPKATLDSLASVLKNAKNAEKTAQKSQKQASQTLAFTDKFVGMDSLGQRKNLRKAWKQVKELDDLLNPPKEKPVAEVLGTEGVSGSPVDSAALAETAVDKKKIKEKKPEKTGPKYKPYDPAADPMRTPPQRPCSLAVNSRDEFSGETYRETQREELFRYTNEVMKKILPPAQPHITCEAALSAGGATSGLHLTFQIRDANARKAFGGLTKNSIAVLKFIDGTTLTVNNLRNDDGALDASGQVFIYRAHYALDPSILKKIRKNELDKIRVAWSTGYEDYEVQGIDVLMRLGKCLGE
jgi:hypothetical protein